MRAISRLLLLAALCLPLSMFSHAQEKPDSMGNSIRAEIGFLASDALNGRGSGTHDELVAATYLASQLQQIGIEPAGDHGDYIQDVVTERTSRSGEKMPWNTRNVLGILHGRDEHLKDEVILLSAHLDHLGIRKPVNGDSIYNGADDDASGCVAVLQLAAALAHGEAPKRTVVFAFFGSEETGGQGDQFFLAHPPVPLKSIVANLEFEMIGRPDPAVKPDELWLTGFDRSNLGPNWPNMAPSWWLIRIRKKSSFNAQTITLWTKKASSRTRSPALVCTKTITSRAMTWPTLTSIIWSRPSSQ